MEHLFTMSTAIFLLLILLFYGMSYLILNRQAYFLISGFNNRPKEEQEALIERGSPQATGKLLRFIGVVLTIGFIFHLGNVRYALEVAIVLMIVLTFGGFIYIQKYELPEKRKKGYFTSGFITGVSFLIMFVISMIGFSSPQVTITEEHVHISGMYRFELPFDSIESVELLEDMPKVQRRTNGFAFAGYLKGHFLVEGLGKGRLYIQGDRQPYLLIQTTETFVILNGEDVRHWYDLIERDSFND